MKSCLYAITYAICIHLCNHLLAKEIKLFELKTVLDCNQLSETLLDTGIKLEST